MTDYDKSTGASGTMRIRDLGSTVEFWLLSGYSSTFFGSATFTYSSPNGSGSFAHGYNSGNTWQKMGQITVTSSGTVSWTMPSTGTSSLGGPTTQSVSLSRQSAPGQNTNFKVSGIDHVGADFVWTRGAMNGGTFDFDQIQISSTAQSGSDNFSGTVEVTATDTSGANYTTTALKPGRKYWAHVRTKNNVGYGAWSSIITFTTLAGARVKVSGVWKDAVPYVKVSGAWKPAVPYVKEGSNPGSWKATG